MRVKKTAPCGPTVPAASVPSFRRFDNKRNANLLFKSSNNRSLYEHDSTPKKRRAGLVHDEGDKSFKPICNENQNLKNAANQGATEQDGDIEPQSYASESVESVDSGDEVGLDQSPQNEQPPVPESFESVDSGDEFGLDQPRQLEQPPVPESVESVHSGDKVGLDQPPQIEQPPVSESVESVDSGDEVGLDQPPQTEQPPVSESLHVVLGDCLMKIDQMSYILKKVIDSRMSWDKSLKDKQKANVSLHKELKTLRRDNKHLRRRVDDAETQISALKIVANKYYVMKETFSELKTEWEDFKISTLTRHKQMDRDLQIQTAQISSLEQELDSLRKILRLEKEKASNALKLAELCEKQDQDFQQKLNNAIEDFKASREYIKETSSSFRLQLEL